MKSLNNYKNILFEYGASKSIIPIEVKKDNDSLYKYIKNNEKILTIFKNELISEEPISRLKSYDINYTGLNFKKLKKYLGDVINILHEIYRKIILILKKIPHTPENSVYRARLSDLCQVRFEEDSKQNLDLWEVKEEDFGQGPATLYLDGIALLRNSILNKVDIPKEVSIVKLLENKNIEVYYDMEFCLDKVLSYDEYLG